MRAIPLFFVFVAILAAARADVSLAPLFTDHAVLQRDKAVPIWGRAAPGEAVTVRFGEQAVSTVASADGRWMVFLTPLYASSESAELMVVGTNTIRISDIVVGDVWLCSGQSNMAFPVSRAQNAAAEIAAAGNPSIRHIAIKHQVSDTPIQRVDTSGWQTATPQTVGDFTAVGYFFARNLQPRLGVPVGIIHSSWGGTPIEAWMSPASLGSDPAFAVVGKRWQQALAEFPAKKAAYDAEMLEIEAAAADAKAKGIIYKLPPSPRAPAGPGHQNTPSGLFNGMINPLLPYALRGALWYQGEANANRASEYHALFAAMITYWRQHFGQEDFPFLWVQLANYKAGGNAAGTEWAFLREAQAQTLSLPATGQAVAIDIGNPDDIHPTNKQEVGRRLSLIARRLIYGGTLDDTGPVFASATREGAAMRVRFSTGAEALTAYERPLQSFEIAGVDRKFFPAIAKIDRDTVIVSAVAVKEPVAVRYAWSNAPVVNLFNGAGLPAAPFRSDNW